MGKPQPARFFTGSDGGGEVIATGFMSVVVSIVFRRIPPIASERGRRRKRRCATRRDIDPSRGAMPVFPARVYTSGWSPAPARRRASAAGHDARHARRARPARTTIPRLPPVARDARRNLTDKELQA
ncbi:MULTISPECIES: hypothetical protein [unclassified Burkholderia]|uniref:hypothetical protein n=1 Tax=unclassified Burkholderia TaxID=2613784 RepID=UPI00141F2352|nr:MULTISPECIES: hypothetical protein [unclassified Burkholderia]NIE87694.1 hypothetical protein [Burkholderia sp. Tr-860]NIF63410.1 hypothetical protein [Burkholderia sp. Cy-647]NIF98824.1 hypothetical protein [Burkholderia sp. Ax-1720]